MLEAISASSSLRWPASSSGMDGRISLRTAERTPASRSRTVRRTRRPEGMRVTAVMALRCRAVRAGHARSRLGRQSDPGVKRALRLFDVNKEANLPAWFSSSVLLVSSLVLWATAREKSAVHDRYARHWWVLAAVFRYLSLDELISLHEATSGMIREALDVSDEGALSQAWILHAAPLVGAAVRVGLPAPSVSLADTGQVRDGARWLHLRRGRPRDGGAGRLRARCAWLRHHRVRGDGLRLTS